MRDLKQITAMVIANTLYQKANEGGCMNIDYDPPTDGYLIHIKDGPVFPNTLSVCPFDVAAFIQDSHDSDGPELFYGVWKDEKTGEVHFNQSMRVEDKGPAMVIAEDFNQKTIWDVAAAKGVQVEDEEQKEFTVQFKVQEVNVRMVKVSASSKEEAIEIAMLKSLPDTEQVELLGVANTWDFKVV